MRGRGRLELIALVLWVVVGLIACAPVGETSVAPPASVPSAAATADAAGMIPAQVATLRSLKKVDDSPLYTMRYGGPYEVGVLPEATAVNGRSSLEPAQWACSLFAAMGDHDGGLYGRNFDWEHSPALLLFTHPPDGYASVSMVGLAYLGFDEGDLDRLTELPLEGRLPLLRTPGWPFDGMNEHGLTVGMAAVPESALPHQGDKETVGSLTLIRMMLDRARNVPEALRLMEGVKVDWSGGPALHYLIADASGQAALVEYYQGEMVAFPNEEPWHLATNFLLAATGGQAGGQCPRYDRIAARLVNTEGRLGPREAMDLLSQVSAGHTQWSIVYGMSTGEVHVAMGKAYERVHAFSLEMGLE